jgi:hypothetical protein
VIWVPYKSSSRDFAREPESPEPAILDPAAQLQFKLLCQRSVLANRVDKIRKSRLSFSHSFANAVFYDPAFQIIRLPSW